MQRAVGECEHHGVQPRDEDNSGDTRHAEVSGVTRNREVPYTVIVKSSESENK